MRQRAGGLGQEPWPLGARSSSVGDRTPQAPLESIQPEEGEFKVATTRPGGKKCKEEKIFKKKGKEFPSWLSSGNKPD